ASRHRRRSRFDLDRDGLGEIRSRRRPQPVFEKGNARTGLDWVCFEQWSVAATRTRLVRQALSSAEAYLALWILAGLVLCHACQSSTAEADSCAACQQRRAQRPVLLPRRDRDQCLCLCLPAALRI